MKTKAPWNKAPVLSADYHSVLKFVQLCAQTAHTRTFRRTSKEWTKQDILSILLQETITSRVNNAKQLTWYVSTVVTRAAALAGKRSDWCQETCEVHVLALVVSTCALLHIRVSVVFLEDLGGKYECDPKNQQQTHNAPNFQIQFQSPLSPKASVTAGLLQSPSVWVSVCQTVHQSAFISPNSLSELCWATELAPQSYRALWTAGFLGASLLVKNHSLWLVEQNGETPQIIDTVCPHFNLHLKTVDTATSRCAPHV